jgi:hypothetical protein
VKLEPKIEATNVRIYQDVDTETDIGYELAEQFFSDGSSVLMHLNQYQAIAVGAAKMADTVLYNNGEGPMPQWLVEDQAKKAEAKNA